MTMPDSSDEEAAVTLSTFNRALLLISFFLASFLLGSGIENFMDEGSNWIQIYKAVFPALIMLCVGYLWVESSES